MSALEIMDPKMESGIVCNYYSLDEAIDDGATPVPISFNKTIDVQCMIDNMDHLLSCEATWHKGHSLAQTVLSCIYLLKPERTSSHALLHSCCRVICATCKAVVSVVSDARTHEDPVVLTEKAHELYPSLCCCDMGESWSLLKCGVETEHPRIKELDTGELLKQLPALQQLLFRVLSCEPHGAAAPNFVIQLALSMVTSESVKIYQAINDGIMNLVDKFFEMQRNCNDP